MVLLTLFCGSVVNTLSGLVILGQCLKIHPLLNYVSSSADDKMTSCDVVNHFSHVGHMESHTHESSMSLWSNSFSSPTGNAVVS